MMKTLSKKNTDINSELMGTGAKTMDNYQKAIIKQLEDKPENSVTCIDKIYLIIVYQFIFMMILVQIY